MNASTLFGDSVVSCVLMTLKVFCSLFNVKIGAEIIEFARSVAHSGPAKVRTLNIDFQTDAAETGIVGEMLNIFQTTCPFYELKWYEL